MLPFGVMSCAEWELPPRTEGTVYLGKRKSPASREAARTDAEHPIAFGAMPPLAKTPERARYEGGSNGGRQSAATAAGPTAAGPTAATGVESHPAAGTSSRRSQASTEHDGAQLPGSGRGDQDAA